MIKQYRKKPVVIEAMHFGRDTVKDIVAWCGANTVKSGNTVAWLSVFTLEGNMKAEKGDYIIKGVKGEFYPCKPDIFAATYEAVESNNQTEDGGNNG